jgi:hypothetical protein
VHRGHDTRCWWQREGMALGNRGGAGACMLACVGGRSDMVSGKGKEKRDNNICLKEIEVGHRPPSPSFQTHAAKNCYSTGRERGNC